MNDRHQRVDWSSLTAWERHTLGLHAMEHLGKLKHAMNAAERHGLDGIPAEQRRVFIEEQAADMVRSGTVPVLAVTQVRTELARPGNERVLATVNEQTGKVSSAVLAPLPYYIRRKG